MGLNPCFSGTYSQRNWLVAAKRTLSSLNPCFSGTYSQSTSKKVYTASRLVLILVLVEHTLREGYARGYARSSFVLILVLVEHTLRVL